MFDDPKKELQILEQQLLEEEEWFKKELDEAKAMIGDGPRKAPAKKAPKAAPAQAERPKKKPADQGEPSPEQKKVRNTETKKTKKKKKGIRGLVILAVLETLGIVGVVAYWLLFLL